MLLDVNWQMKFITQYPLCDHVSPLEHMLNNVYIKRDRENIYIDIYSYIGSVEVLWVLLMCWAFATFSIFPSLSDLTILVFGYSCQC